VKLAHERQPGSRGHGRTRQEHDGCALSPDQRPRATARNGNCVDRGRDVQGVEEARFGQLEVLLWDRHQRLLYIV
jgi:hypothetical protein